MELDPLAARIVDSCRDAQLTTLANLLCDAPPDYEAWTIRMEGGKTPLHVLAEANSPELERTAQTREVVMEPFGALVTLLLSTGLDINAVDDQDRTCLHIAAKKGTAGFLSILLSRGANPLAIAKGNLNILHFAVENHDHEVWSLLLTTVSGVPNCLTQKSKSGVTPTSLACLSGNAVAVSILSQYYQPSFQWPSPPNSPIFLTDALRKNTSKPLLKAIFKGMDHSNILSVLNAEVKSVKGPWITYCARFAPEESISALLHFGADPSIPDPFGWLPLHYTLQRQFIQASTELAKSMPPNMWNHVDRKGRSFLYWFVTMAAPVANLTKTSGAISIRPTLWESLWYYLFDTKITLENGNSMSILQLLCTEPSLGDVDPAGNFPIHHLSQRDLSGYATSLVSTLIPIKRLWSQNAKGSTALHLATKNRAHSTLSILLNALSVSSSEDNVTPDLLRSNTQPPHPKNKFKEQIINMKDARGKTALFYAIKSGHNPSIQLLLDHEASTEMLDSHDSNAIGIAAKYQCLYVLVQLIHNGIGTLEEAKNALQDYGFRSSIAELEKLHSTLPMEASENPVAGKIPLLKLSTIQVSDLSPVPHYCTDNSINKHILGNIDGLLQHPVSSPRERAPESQSLLAKSCGSNGDPPQRSPTKTPPVARKLNRTSASSPTLKVSAHLLKDPGLSLPLGPLQVAAASSTPTQYGKLSHPSSASHFNRPRVPSWGGSEIRPLVPNSESSVLLRKDSSSDSLRSTNSSIDEQGSDSSELEEPSNHIPHKGLGFSINLENVPESCDLASPKSVPIGWGPSPPSSNPLSPRLSPRSISPRGSRPGTPPGTPALDRMKLQRSLSPRSLPTIMESNPTAAPSQPPAEKPSKRNRSNSMKKSIMMRSRSLTKLPASPDQDFLEVVRYDQQLSPRIKHDAYSNTHLRSHSSDDPGEAQDNPTPQKRHRSGSKKKGSSNGKVQES